MLGSGSKLPCFRLSVFLAVSFSVVAVFLAWFSLKAFIRLPLEMERSVEELKNVTSSHVATVIFLHGLGDTGGGVSAIFDEIRQPHIKYIFPAAKNNPVTVNHGMVMPSWFDIHGLKSSSSEDEASIEAAAHLLQTFIAEEEKLGVERNRIVVGGISQGGATSLYSLLTIPQSPLAGIIGLSTWLPLHEKFPDVAKANFETPMLLCHGEADPLVSVDFGRLSYERIKQFNKKVQFKTYPGLRHWVHDEEMKEVERFINACLPPHKD